MMSLVTSSMINVISVRAASNDQAFLIFITLLFGCYLVGSIPTSYLFAKYVKGVDIRRYGSGNSGATNASRLLGKPFFFLILAIDAIKAYGSVALSAVLLPEMNEYAVLACAAAVLVGNAFSIFIRFHGGKAVATSVGLLCYFLPSSLVAIYLGIFLGMFAIGRRVDVAALSMFVGGAFSVAYFSDVSSAVVYAAWILALWVWARHWQNILYLLGWYTPKF